MHNRFGGFSGLVLSVKKAALSGAAATVTLFFALASFGLLARTGYQGGQIRHTEINTTGTTTIDNVTGNDDE